MGNFYSKQMGSFGRNLRATSGIAATEKWPRLTGGSEFCENLLPMVAGSVHTQSAIPIAAPADQLRAGFEMAGQFFGGLLLSNERHTQRKNRAV